MREQPVDAHAAMPLLMTRAAVVDRYFMEHRAKLLDLAAFLDRCDRAPAPAPGSPRSPTEGPTSGDSGDSGDSGGGDFRLAALRRAIALLTDDQPQRARRILEMLSDPSESPLDHAPGKSATGAPPPLPRDKSRR